MVSRVKVYVCQEPEHEKLVSTLKDLLEKTRGKKPKMEVVKLKISRADDFPYYIQQLEELFGGIATAEYRKYGIQSLPAIVYNDRVIIQGHVPTREELEESLAYEGLKIVHEVKETPPIVQKPPVQPQQTTQKPVEKTPVRIKIPIEPSVVRTSQEPTQAVSESIGRQPAKSIDRVEDALLLRREPRAPTAFPQPQQAKDTESAMRTVSEAPKPVITTPPLQIEVGKQLQPSKTTREDSPKPVYQPPDIEETLVGGVTGGAKVVQAQDRRQKNCLNCIFYERGAKKCLLYRTGVQDPFKPLCR
ncbi:MAG: thioredoxin family protein [Thermofilaceae archaeon]|nr:thioredoxin family protein [Thermofilaceae archaeon]